MLDRRHKSVVRCCTSCLFLSVLSDGCLGSEHKPQLHACTNLCECLVLVGHVKGLRSFLQSDQH